ncbi:uncharacterized protein BYT42DRAFT_578837 [Radiomyces spectabilis]|uniref:uncharacterized protein n=1 Tax=Radiomyces spectabilis TaxID=64574 RepID=UPI00221ECC58|nr:uncharacterized protein BYT42DRAFT_578837 [Radiomyces spectabilis]KAI8373003.1 hypothetical protein BYT42DRAFT_578837 [Radiomyces spectabilis]
MPECVYVCQSSMSQAASKNHPPPPSAPRFYTDLLSDYTQALCYFSPNAVSHSPITPSMSPLLSVNHPPSISAASSSALLPIIATGRLPQPHLPTTMVATMGVHSPLTRTATPPSSPLPTQADHRLHYRGATTAQGLRRRPRRRTSNQPDLRMFSCTTEGCDKVFKRSEHLKRHIRSVHTLEKRKWEIPAAMETPQNHHCKKRFSRSDNLNQHIRVHVHS